METRIEVKDNLIVVRVVGRLVASSAEDVKKVLTEQVAKCPNILCDLSGMTHIDSSGLGVLVCTLQACKTAGGTCRIACLQPHPRIVFDITKVFRVFDIYDTVEAAEKAFA